MKLASYPEYKDSGVSWLGKIPAHWDATKLKRVSHVQTGVTLGKRYRKAVLIERPYLRVANVQNGFLNLKHIKTVAVPAKEAELAELRTGDVVITEGGDIDKLGRGAIWNGEIEHCLHQNHIFAIRPVLSSLIPGFLSRMTESYHGRSYFYLTSKRTTNLASTNQTTLGLLPLFLPSIEEQTQIARFLDWKAAQINKFIRNKRRLIELLKEQKQSIINQAVTRGLDPNVKFKLSGVEWIGDIPTHWKVRRLKQFAKVQTGITLGPIASHDGLIERPYLRVANVQNGRLDLDTVKTVFVPVREIPYRELKEGDVLMTEGGDMDKLGRGCIWRNEVQGCLHQNHVFAVRTNKDDLSSEYLVRLMESRHGRTYFELTAKRTTNLASTNSSTLGRFPIPLPPINEQNVILEQLHEKSVEIDQTITRAQREIELMREYRTRLISDVVTGQVDVRGIEVPEVTEEELLALDEDTAYADDVIDDEGDMDEAD